MLRKFKIVSNLGRDVIVMATSKYNAKTKFYAMHPRCCIFSVEEVEE